MVDTLVTEHSLFECSSFCYWLKRPLVCVRKRTLLLLSDFTTKHLTSLSCCCRALYWYWTQVYVPFRCWLIDRFLILTGKRPRYTVAHLSSYWGNCLLLLRIAIHVSMLLICNAKMDKINGKNVCIAFNVQMDLCMSELVNGVQTSLAHTTLSVGGDDLQFFCPQPDTSRSCKDHGHGTWVLPGVPFYFPAYAATLLGDKVHSVCEKHAKWRMMHQMKWSILCRVGR